MVIDIICIGKIKETYLQEGIKEYQKRLSKYTSLNIIELEETKLAKKHSRQDIENVINEEGLKIISRIKTSSYIILLDVQGQQIDNEQYVKNFNKALLDGYSTITFIIGGSYGLSASLKQMAHFKWSFSQLVFTHQMFRLLLLEQIYRGFKIKYNEPYHK
ncbi:MAG: 23S rRNA (pseudouridine(1915)-N(3))-methyltransferase RlmH [Bacilli bacterium]